MIYDIILTAALFCATLSAHCKLHTTDRATATASLVRVTQALVGLCECTHREVASAAARAVGIVMESSLDLELLGRADDSKEAVILSEVRRTGAYEEFIFASFSPSMTHPFIRALTCMPSGAPSPRVTPGVPIPAKLARGFSCHRAALWQDKLCSYTFSQSSARRYDASSRRAGVGARGSPGWHHPAHRGNCG